jgi:hypothetical protein
MDDEEGPHPLSRRGRAARSAARAAANVSRVPSGAPASGRDACSVGGASQLEAVAAGERTGGRGAAGARQERPSASLALAVPAPGGRPGIWRVAGSWEQQAYADEAPSGPDGAVQSIVRREERRRTELSFADWVSSSLRLEVGAALDKWSGRGAHLSLGAGIQALVAGDRVSLSAHAAQWASLAGGAPFGAGGLLARWSTEHLERGGWQARLAASSDEPSCTPASRNKHGRARSSPCALGGASLSTEPRRGIRCERHGFRGRWMEARASGSRGCDPGGNFGSRRPTVFKMGNQRSRLAGRFTDDVVPLAPGIRYPILPTRNNNLARRHLRTPSR